MDVKDWFQFGVPTLILFLLAYKGPAILQGLSNVLERLSVPFLAAIKGGFGDLNKAIESSNVRWQEMIERMHKEDREQLMNMHKENRADIEKDRDLRHSTNALLQAALGRLNEQEIRLSAELRRLGLPTNLPS